MKEMTVYGKGVSAGIGIGRLYVYRPPEAAAADRPDSADPFRALERAREAVERYLRRLIRKTEREAGKDQAAILSGHLSILNDPMFYGDIAARVKAGEAAATAVRAVARRLADHFRAMDGGYMRERADDIDDIAARLLRGLSGESGTSLSALPDGEWIVAADALLPSETAELDLAKVRGLILMRGGETSHTVLMARSVGLPVVIGPPRLMDSLRHGETAAIDGGTGQIVLRPDLSVLRQRMADRRREEAALAERYRHRPAVTADGVRIELAINIGSAEEAALVHRHGADGVGLFRTEYLFMQRPEPPDEQTQFEEYRRAVSRLHGKPAVIRTLDVGGDKPAAGLGRADEANPFLGFRAIRLCLQRRDVFRTQLRAILRASAYGRVMILVPMIALVREFVEAKAEVERVREALEKEGALIAPRVEVGLMIETPSAALMARELAREADFFSIGTNDLTQYTLAVDRMNEHVAELYDHYHPAVLRLMKHAADCAREAGKRVGICGGMAGEELAAPLLIGMGIREWSMPAPAVPAIKRYVSKLTFEMCADLCRRVLEREEPGQVRSLLERMRREVIGG